jgi:hypothetical protein
MNFANFWKCESATSIAVDRLTRKVGEPSLSQKQLNRPTKNHQNSGISFFFAPKRGVQVSVD